MFLLFWKETHFRCGAAKSRVLDGGCLRDDAEDRECPTHIPGRKDEFTGHAPWKLVSGCILLVALIWGGKPWLFLKTDDLWNCHSFFFYFCVHLTRSFIHSSTSCCTHSPSKKTNPPLHRWTVSDPRWWRMDTRLSLPGCPLLVLLCAAAALSGTRSPLAAAGRSCADTRQVYAEKGYGTDTAPTTQISGKTPPCAQRDGPCRGGRLTHISPSLR